MGAGGVCAGEAAGAVARSAPPGVTASGIASLLPRLLATKPPPPTRAASTRIPIIHHARFESSELELKSGLVVDGVSGAADSPAVAAVSGATEAVGVAGSEGTADSEIVSTGVGVGDVVGVALIDGLGVGLGFFVCV